MGLLPPGPSPAPDKEISTIRLFRGCGLRSRSTRAAREGGSAPGIHAVCLWAALHPGASGAAPLALILGTFWIALSLVLPRVRRNPLVGIRTAWTLASDENWAKTHRFAGLVGVPAGLVVIAAGLAGGFPAAIAAIAVSALASAAYSFIESRREQAPNA